QPARAVHGLARMLDVAHLAGERHVAARVRTAGFARVIPPPVDAGTDGGGRRRPLGWPAAVRYRRWLAGPRAHEPWLPPGQYSGAHGSLSGSYPDHGAPAPQRRAADLRRQVLPVA